MDCESTDFSKVYLRSLNPFITCILCGGYFIDATTIPECLHTFCKSCIVKHLDECNTCPRCDLLIHQGDPKSFISYDRTMQDIVYKLVPGLYNEEMIRRQEFCRKMNIPFDNPLDDHAFQVAKPVQTACEDPWKDPIDVLCNNEMMGKDHNLRFIQKTRWRGKEHTPLELRYREHIDL